MVVIEAGDAAQRGLPAVTIKVDVKQSGMFARPFPGAGVLLLLNGPPGAPLVLGIWGCAEKSAKQVDLETVIRAKLVAPWAKSVVIGKLDHARVAGEDRPAMTCFTGTGPARIAWFGVIVERPAGVVFVAAGVGAGESDSVSVDQILANRAIGAAMRSLEID